MLRRNKHIPNTILYDNNTYLNTIVDLIQYEKKKTKNISVKRVVQWHLTFSRLGSLSVSPTTPPPWHVHSTARGPRKPSPTLGHRQMENI